MNFFESYANFKCTSFIYQVFSTSLQIWNGAIAKFIKTITVICSAPAKKNSVANGHLTSMEGLVASTDPPFKSEMVPHVNENLSISEAELIRPILTKFSGSMKATLSHLTTVHNETCGCQTGSTSQEVINRVWNQKKVKKKRKIRENHLRKMT